MDAPPSPLPAFVTLLMLAANSSRHFAEAYSITCVDAASETGRDADSKRGDDVLSKMGEDAESSSKDADELKNPSIVSLLTS